MNKILKICYIVPSVDRDTGTHFYEKYELLDAVSPEADIRLLSGEGAFPILFLRICLARVAGYRNFYIHYSFKGGLAAILAANVFGGKVWYWNCGMPWLYKRSKKEEWVFRFILRNAVLVTGTPGIADEYRKHYGISGKIEVVPNSVRTGRFGATKPEARKQLGIRDKDYVVLFAHRLSRRKGAHLLPDIIAQWKGNKNVLFLIAGDGPERREIESRLQDLNLSDKVIMCGSVPNKNMPQYFAAADVYIMPSEEEGFPNALLEAMAAGVPFVASDVGGVKEMTPSELHGYVLPSGDLPAFHKALVRIFEDKTEAERISEKEKEWARRYDIVKVKKQFLALFA